MVIPYNKSIEIEREIEKMKSYDASVLISIMDNYNVDINKAYEVYNKISRKERAELRRKYIEN